MTNVSNNWKKRSFPKQAEKLQKFEQNLKKDEERCSIAPTVQNLQTREETKAEYEQECDYIVKGSIIRSRETWYEKGEHNNKYLQLKNEVTNTNPKTLLNEIKSFYSNLYEDDLSVRLDEASCSFLNSPKI